ncbi:MAG: hypothetical protein JWM73_3054 [Solirubrobacterales bacterium]|nr:hypothetical protein [Solirubrobacterales bacterium]
MRTRSGTGTFAALLGAIALLGAAPALADVEVRATYTGSGSITTLVDMIPCDTDAGVTPCWTGSATEEYEMRSWRVDYPTVSLDQAVTGGTLTSLASPAAETIDWTVRDQADYYDANTVQHQDCAGPLKVDPAGLPVLVQITPSSATTAQVAVEGPGTPMLGAVDLSGCPHDFPFPAPLFRDALYGTATVTAAQIADGSADLPLSFAGLGADCTFPARDNASDADTCTQTNAMTGSVHLEASCGSVKATDPSTGKPIDGLGDLAPGQTVSGGAHGVDLTFEGGVEVRVAKGTSLAVPPDCLKFVDDGGSLLKLTLGRIWAFATHAAQEGQPPPVEVEHAVVGTRAAALPAPRKLKLSYTLSGTRKGRTLHMVRGELQLPARRGGAIVKRGQTVFLPAGKGHARRVAWSKADRALVPPRYR